MGLTDMTTSFKKSYLSRELEALIKIRHKHAIRVYDIMRCDNKLFVFMEFAGNGDISHYVSKNGRLSEKKASKWFGQTISALEYIHREFRMAHR